jgi:tetratricopeptide (TPR) repeat protein
MKRTYVWTGVLTALLATSMVALDSSSRMFAAQKEGGGGKGGGGDRGNQGGGAGERRENNNSGQGGNAGNNQGTIPVAPRVKINSNPGGGAVRVAPRDNRGGNRPGVQGQGNAPRIRGNIGNNNTNIRGNVPLGRGGNNLRLRTNLNNNFPNRFSGGNSIRLGNRDIRIVGRAYNPSHFRHNWYRGFSSGRWGWGQGWGYGNPRYSVGYRGNVGNNWGGNWRYGINGRNRWGNGYGGYRPLGWGLGSWGLGSMAYRSGYLPYSNPYYRSNFGYAYDYSNPINIAYGESQPGTPSETDVLDQAIASFQQGDYQSALNEVNQAITDNPNDPALHEFRSLVLFAMGNYQESAAVAHAVLALGPGWNWETMSALYPSVEIYTEQYRRLESFTKTHPEDAGGRFLLAYHYLTGGHQDAAKRQFEAVVKLNPKDRVSQDLLKLMGNEETTIAENDAAPNAESAETEVQAIQPEQLAGNWVSERKNGDQFELNVSPDSKFTWKFKPGETGEARSINGTISAEGNVLAMESPDEGTLVAVIEPQGDQKFNLKLLGSSDDDPGLEFTQQN